MCETKRRSFLRSSGRLLGGTLLAGKHGIGLKNRPIAETAKRLLAARAPKQPAMARIEFNLNAAVLSFGLSREVVDTVQDERRNSVERDSPGG